MWEFIFYMIIVFPVAYKKYLVEKKYTLFARIVNLVISFILFVFFASEFRRLVWELIDDGVSILTLKTDIGVNSGYFLVSNVMYFLLCFYLSAISINIGMRKIRTRSIFIKSIPFVGLILINYAALLFVKSDASMIGRLPFAYFIATTLWGSVLLILYFMLRTRSVKDLYDSVES